MTKDESSAILNYLCTVIIVRQFDFIPVCLYTNVRFCETNKFYCHCLGVISIISESLHFWCAYAKSRQTVLIIVYPDQIRNTS